MDLTVQATLFPVIYFLSCVFCTDSQTGSSNSEICEKYPCANGGICNILGDGSERLCTCQLGYRGPDCLIDLCKSQPCVNGGTCVRTPDSRQCICPIGFGGEDCSIVSCSAHPCMNGATCLPVFNKRQCICAMGYAKEDCSQDLCENLCLNDGQCVRTCDGADCVCQRGYSGGKCEKSICDPDPCYHGRTCSLNNDNDSFHCNCKYEGGRRCEYDDIVPHGRPLLPFTDVLPKTAEGFIYVPRAHIYTARSYIYGLRVVATGNPTPFNFQIWLQKGQSHWRNLTLLYDQRITLKPEATVQEIKFSDLGIKCAMVDGWSRVGLYFPEGSDGIGLHKCTSRCEVFRRNVSIPSKLTVNSELEFEWKHDFQSHFGIKAYFALEGAHGRRLDSNSCPENTELPPADFGDNGDIVDTKEYPLSFNTHSVTCQSSDMDCQQGQHKDLAILGAVLGGLLLLSIAVIIALVVKLRHHLPQGNPPGGYSDEAIDADGYVIPNGNTSPNRPYLDLRP